MKLQSKKEESCFHKKKTRFSLEFLVNKIWKLAFIKVFFIIFRKLSDKLEKTKCKFDDRRPTIRKNFWAYVGHVYAKRED